MPVQRGGQTLTPAQRAERFALHTRKHVLTLPPLVGLAFGQTVSFNLPKTRLLSKISLLVQGTLNVTTAGTGLPRYSPYSILRRVLVSINNGFNPVTMSGGDIFCQNMAQATGNVFRPAVGGRTVAPGTTIAAHPFRFTAELQISLNERDAVGLVLLQNEETVVSVTVDIGVLSDLMTGGAATLTALSITPVIHTFSIPAVPEAFPDLSILKLQQSQSFIAPTNGMMTIALPVGNTYRKIMVDMPTVTPTGNFELVVNQADVPYSVDPLSLRAMNEEMYNGAMRDIANLWSFDFTFQGLANYGGLRDYIDTERLTEFWLRVPVTAAAGQNVNIIHETLSRLAPVTR